MLSTDYTLFQSKVRINNTIEFSLKFLRNPRSAVDILRQCKSTIGNAGYVCDHLKYCEGWTYKIVHNFLFMWNTAAARRYCTSINKLF